MKAVIANNVSKVYSNGKKAVDDISFTLEEGEVFGFLGPNGAGKTTVVNLLNGMLSPTQGSSTIFDINPSTNPVDIHKISGVLTERAQMYGTMTGLENLIFYGTAFGIEAKESKQRGLELLEQLELTEAKDRKLDTYSTGMRQRLSLARAMIHRPKMLFLDEPTSGLDPESVVSVNQMIKRLAQEEGTTIFLCTHQLRYAQEICTSYGLIDQGSLLALGTLEKLRNLTFSGSTVRFKADRPPTFPASTKVGEMEYEVQVNDENEIPTIIKNMVEEKNNIYSVTNRKFSLEEIYFALIEKQEARKELHHD